MIVNSNVQVKLNLAEIFRQRDFLRKIKKNKKMLDDSYATM